MPDNRIHHTCGHRQLTHSRREPVPADRHVTHPVLIFAMLTSCCLTAGADEITAKLSSEKSWLLGENVHLKLVISNSGPRPIATWLEGDSESPVPLRFRVQVFDSSGEKLPGLYVGRSVNLTGQQKPHKTAIAPNTSETFHIPLMRFSDIRRPGRYRVVVEYRFSEKELPAQQKISDALTESTEGVVRASCDVQITKSDRGKLLVILGRYIARLHLRTRLGRRVDEVDLTTFRFSDSLPLLPQQITGRFEGGDEQLLEAIRLNNGPEAVSALIYLVGHASRETAGQAYARLAEYLEDPGDQKLWTRKTRRAAVQLVLLSGVANNPLRQVELPVAQKRRFVERIIRAFCTPADLEPFARAAESVVFGQDFDHQWHSDLTWHLLCKGKDVPEKQVIDYWTSRSPAEIPQPVFMRLCHYSPNFRPWKWMERWRSLIMSPNPNLRITALKFMPTEINRDLAFEVQRCLQPAWQDERKVHNEALQLAAISFAGRTESSFFVPALFQLAKNASNHRVSAAARDALRRCTPRPREQPERVSTWPPPQLPEDQIPELITALRDPDRRAVSVDALREASGLDFGDADSDPSLRNWYDWWQREEVAIQRVGSQDREFILFGRVTDPSGEPVTGAWVRVYLNGITSGSMGRVAQTLADEQGRYIVRFGFPDGMDSILPTATVRVRASDAGRFGCLPANEPWSLVASRREVEDDPLLQIRSDDAVYPGEPQKLDFTLHPETQLRVDTLRRDGTSTLPHKLQLLFEHDSTALGQSALWTVRDQYHFIHFVTGRTARLEVTLERGATPLRSEPFYFDRPGRFTCTLDAKALEEGSLKVITMESPTEEYTPQPLTIGDECPIPTGIWQSKSLSPELQYSVKPNDPVAADGRGILSQRRWAGTRQISSSTEVTLIRGANGERRILSHLSVIGSVSQSDSGMMEIQLTQEARRVGLVPTKTTLVRVPTDGLLPPVPRAQALAIIRAEDMISQPLWGPKKNNLQLGITTTKALVHQGERIPLRLYISNSGSAAEQLRIPLRSHHGKLRMLSDEHDELPQDEYHCNLSERADFFSCTLQPGEVLPLKFPEISLCAGREQLDWESTAIRGVRPGHWKLQKEIILHREVSDTVSSQIHLSSGRLPVEIIP